MGQSACVRRGSRFTVMTRTAFPGKPGQGAGNQKAGGKEQTCHVLKSERCWSIAAGITLLIPHPGLVELFHEAVLVEARNRSGERGGGGREDRKESLGQVFQPGVCTLLMSPNQAPQASENQGRLKV